MRGSQAVPAARQAFRRLADGSGRLRVPVVFLTNAGNCLRAAKARELSQALGLQVRAGRGGRGGCSGGVRRSPRRLTAFGCPGFGREHRGDEEEEGAHPARLPRER